MTFSGLEELARAGGTDLGVTEWLAVEQPRIDAFAEATGDHQWIHTDPDRAREGPFGTTIAHGLLTLSLLPRFLGQLYQVAGARMTINYGLDRVRFPAPVPVGSSLRGRASIVEVQEVPGGLQAHLSATIELRGSQKPACAATSIARYLA